MPTDVSFPAPDPDRCPACDRAFDGIRCAHCGLALVADDARALWAIDRELHRLTAWRETILARSAVALATGPPPAAPPVREPTVPAAPAPSGRHWSAPGVDAAPQAVPVAAAAPPAAERPGTAASARPPSGGLRPPPPPPPPPPPQPAARVPLWARWELTLPTLLLALGTALLVVAAIVFTAVQWSDLGAALQALALLVVSLGTGWAARALRRRRLTATAEAVAIVALALLPVDVHALREVAHALGWRAGPGGDPLVYWCLSIWGMAAVAWWFGRFSGTRAPRIIAATAAQVPVALYVVDRPVEAPLAELLCLCQAALVLVAVRRAPAAVSGARIAGVVGAVGTWLVVTPVSLAVSLQVDGAARVAGAGVVAAGGAIAGLAAALWADQRLVCTLGTAAGSLVGLAAAGLAASAAVTGFAWFAVAAGISGAVLVLALRLPPRWGDPPALVAALAGAVTSLPVGLVAAVAVNTALAGPDPAWVHSANTPVLALAAPPSYGLPGAGVAVAHLLILALVAAGARPRLGRRVVVGALYGVGVLAVLVVPLAADLTVAAATTIALAAAAVPVASLAQPTAGRRYAVPAGTFAALAGLGLLWAAAAPGTTLVALSLFAVLAFGLTAAATRDGVAAVAYPAAMATVVATVAGAGLAVVASDSPAPTAWVVAGVTAAGATLVAGALGAWLGRAVGERAAATLVVAQGTGIALHVLALLRLAETGDAPEFAVLVAATTLLGAWYTDRGVRDGSPIVASLGAVVLALAAGAEAGLVAAALGAAPTTVTLATGLTAAVAALAFTLVDWRGDRTDARGDAATAGASMAVVVHAGALAVLVAQAAEARDLAVLLAATIVVAGWWTYRAVHAGARGLASVAAAAMAIAIGIEAGLVTAALGAGEHAALVASGLAAVGATLAFAALDWRGRSGGARGDAALAGEVASAAVHVGALVTLVDAGAGPRDLAVLVAATIGLAAWWAYRGVRDGRREMASAGAAVLALAVAAEGGLVAAALGAADTTAALVVGLTAAGATLAFAALDLRGRSGGARGDVALACEATATIAHLGAVVGLVAAGAGPRDVAVLVAATIGLAAWWAYRGVRDGERATAAAGAAALALAVGAEGGLVAAAAGCGVTAVALAVGLTSAGATLPFAALDWRGRSGGARGDAALAGEATGAIVHTGALAALIVGEASTTRDVAVLVAATIGLAAWWAYRGVRDGSRDLATGATGVLALAVAAEGGLVTSALGGGAVAVALAVGLTAAGATLAFALVDPRGVRTRGWAQVATAGEATSAMVHAGALVALLAIAAPVRDLAVLVAASMALATWGVTRGVRDGNRALAASAAAVLAVAAGAEAGLVAAAAGGGSAVVALVVGVTAAVATLAFAALDPSGLRDDARGDAARAGEAAAAAVHVGAIVALAGGPYPLARAGAASVVLAAGAAVAAVQALRPGRRPVAAWAVVEALVLVWLRLAVAGVGVAEAYTLPVAAAFLGAAVIAHRTGLATRFPSWVVDGPWLMMAFVPTVVLAFADGGLVRSLAGLVAGTVALVAGAASRRRAPVDVGVVVVVVLGVRQLAPVVGALPNWATLGACGLLLLVAGATFEERRRDLRAIRDRYANLV